MKLSLTLLAVLVALPAAAAPTADPLVDRFIVRMRDDVQRASPSRAGQVQQVLQAARRAGVQVTHWRRMGLGAEVVRLSRPVPLSQARRAAERLGLQADVEWAAVSQRRRIAALPNDPELSAQYTQDELASLVGAETAADLIRDFGLVSHMWYMLPAVGEGDLKARRLTANWLPLWESTGGFADPSYASTVAVVDTGIVPHSDLATGRILPGYDFIQEAGTARDSNGRDSDPRDEGDWDNGSECGVFDSSWHGTFVAGVVGASANNGTGIAGVNPAARLLPVRALGKCGGYDEDIIDGTLWAAGQNLQSPWLGDAPTNANPAGVINLSLGGEGICEASYQTMVNLLRTAGVAVVAAAGNDRRNAGNFAPANCVGVITVGATSLAGSLTDYSNFGSVLAVSAPGGGTTFKIASTSNAGRTRPGAESIARERGTSFAAPLVTGAISLIQAVRPGISVDQLQAVLRQSATPFPSETDCTVLHCGAGVVDVANAVRLAASHVSASKSVLQFAKGGSSNKLSDVVTLRNDGSSSVALGVPMVSSPAGAANDYDVMHNCPSTLAAGGSCQITVQFDPQSSGARYAVLQLGAADATLRLPLFGVNQGAVLTPLATGVLQFSAAVGEISSPQTVLFRNDSASPLTFGSLPLITSNSFELAGYVCDGVVFNQLDDCLLPPGAELGVQLVFHPLAAGTYDATVNVKPAEGLNAQVSITGVASDGGSGGGGSGGGGGGCTTGRGAADLGLLLWPALFWLRRRRS